MIVFTFLFPVLCVFKFPFKFLSILGVTLHIGFDADVPVTSTYHVILQCMEDLNCIYTFVRNKHSFFTVEYLL